MHSSPWLHVAGPMLHPSDTHLDPQKAPVHIFGGELLCHERTGRYVLSVWGILRHVPQRWARQLDELTADTRGVAS
jgi:hypothetical protein